MTHAKLDHSISGLVVLEELYKIFETNGTWIQNCFACDRYGHSVALWHEDACSFCLTAGLERAGLNVGALELVDFPPLTRTVWGDGMRKANKALDISMKYKYGDRSKVGWNDEIRRTQRSIRQLVTRAIKIYKTQYDKIKEEVNYVQVR